MKCPECLGELFEEGHYDVPRIVDDHPVLLRNVLARRCSQCGYLVVSATTAKEIERRMRDGHRDSVATVDVYDLASPSADAGGGSRVSATG